MNRYYSSVAKTAAGVIAVLSAVIATPIAAQDLNSLWQAGEQKLKLAQASQDRVDAVVEQTRSLESQYQTVLKEIEGLQVYNTLLQRQVNDQQDELKDLNESIDKVTVIERQVMPLMLRMVDGLEEFVKLDVPFLMDERMGRVNKLRDLMDDADVTPAEKFRQVTEAFQIENDYGRKIETYKDTLQIEGGTREVDILRIGRIGLYYQSSDASATGRWNQGSRQWEALNDGVSRNQIRQGLAIARKEVAPDLLLLPIDAPEAAQ